MRNKDKQERKAHQLFHQKGNESLDAYLTRVDNLLEKEHKTTDKVIHMADIFSLVARIITVSMVILALIAVILGVTK